MDPVNTSGTPATSPESEPSPTPPGGNGAGHAADADAGAGGKGTGTSADDGNSFWSGDPSALEGEALAQYRGFQSAFTRKTQEVAAQRRALAEREAALGKQQAELQQLAVQLQARMAAEPTPDPRGRGGESPQAPTDLRPQFDRMVAAGQGYEAIEWLAGELVSRRATPLVSEREKALRAEIDALKGSLGELSGKAAPLLRRNELDAAFDRLRAGRYKGDFDSPKVQAAILSELQSGDDVITSLLEAGNTEAAIALAGERAIRTVNEGGAIERARRRAEATPPTGQDVPAAGVRKSRKDFDNDTQAWVKHLFQTPEARAAGIKPAGEG